MDEHADAAEALYILGDFVDAWLGDDDDAELAQAIQARLARFTASGRPCYFVHGNRDFLIGSGFAERTGVTLLTDSAVIDLYGRRALIMHGDTLCTADTEYLKFRAMVRNPAWQAEVLGKPLPVRRQMAAALRAQSKSLNAMKASDIMDVTPDEVEAVMAAAEVDLLIHGHTHRPGHHTLTVEGKPAERWVLGDWGQYGWYLRAAPGEMALESFPISEQI